jgi:hypothetical protein
VKRSKTAANNNVLNEIEPHFDYTSAEMAEAII